MQPNVGVSAAWSPVGAAVLGRMMEGVLMPRAKKPVRLNFVEQALVKLGGGHGSQAELARQLAKQSGRPIERAHVQGYKRRGRFPRDMIEPVAELFGFDPLALAMELVKEKDPNTGVAMALREYGKILGLNREASSSELAVALTVAAKREVTRQDVNEWGHTGTFPLDMLPYVEKITGIPRAQLLTKKKGKPKPV